MREQLLEILKTYWNYPSFRPGQEAIICSVAEGKDTLALMPTGGGKSICFQVPALYSQKLCLVVSPLIALMKDQVEQLERRQISARAIYSGQSFKEQQYILNECVDGHVQFLYLSPERLKSFELTSRLMYMSIGLLAIDEAHCISQWGFDFRPDYREIAAFRKQIPGVPVLALTATATPEVVQDIQQQLSFKSPCVFQSSFARNNLSYIVRETENKEEQLIHIFEKTRGSGLVYVRNRRKTEEVAYLLQQHGISADFYHAGLSTAVRNKKQDDWIENRTRIMVCTNAFGMGIDKPDCRIVVHFEPPDSPEAYYQEAGRAGRDGKKSYVVILYHPSDAIQLQQKLQSQFPDIGEIRRVYQALCSFFHIPVGNDTHTAWAFSMHAFCTRYELKAPLVLSAFKWLEACDLIGFNESLNEASKIRFVVGAGTIYKIQVEQPEFEPILKLILRSYGGVYDHYTRISEELLASKLQVPLAKIQSLLHRLHAYGILDYQAAQEGPHIWFRQTRVASQDIQLDEKLYLQRKETMLEKIQAMISYCQNQHFQCRSKLLLAYFGELDAEDCGRCDICMSRNHPKYSLDTFENIRKQIEAILREKPISLPQLKHRLNYLDLETVSECIRMLFDEQHIHYNEHLELCWKDEKK